MVQPEMQIEIRAKLIIYNVYGEYTGYAPDFPGIIAIGTSSEEVINKLKQMLYQLAISDIEQYKFSLN